jgi:hypothetical protein
MRTVSNLLHTMTSYFDIPNSMTVITNINRFLLSSGDIPANKRMMNVQMIASAVKRIGVEKFEAAVHDWIIEEATLIMELKVNDTENYEILGNLYGLLWYINDAKDMGKVEKEKTDKLIRKVKERFLKDRAYSWIKV